MLEERKEELFSARLASVAQQSTLKIEAVRSSETLVNLYPLFLLPTCLPYSSTLMMEAVLSARLRGITSKNVLALLVAFILLLPGAAYFLT
jgi:hypothetical protein